MAASPVTQANVARESMTVRKMYEAIMYRNNNAAANLLMRRSGGPASLPTLLRSIGDRVTRIDDYEGHVTERPLPADSSASRAIIETVRRIISSLCCPSRRDGCGKAGWSATSFVDRGCVPAYPTLRSSATGPAHVTTSVMILPLPNGQASRPFCWAPTIPTQD
jgi:hypothetical protein